MAQLSILSGATLLPHPSRISTAHVGRATMSVVERGWADDASDRLLLSPPTALSAQGAVLNRPPAICVLSCHSSSAASNHFVSAVWTRLARLRNASRDGWLAWRGGGETEVRCIQQLLCDRQEALADIARQQQQRQQPSIAALCRPPVLDAWIDSLRQLLTHTVLNIGCTHAQTDAILHSYETHHTHTHSTSKTERCRPCCTFTASLCRPCYRPLPLLHRPAGWLTDCMLTVAARVRW